jgi:hypothetical protein
MRSRLLAPLSLLLLIQISLARQSQTTTGEVPETSPVSNGSDYPTSVAVSQGIGFRGISIWQRQTLESSIERRDSAS